MVLTDRHALQSDSSMAQKQPFKRIKAQWRGLLFLSLSGIGIAAAIGLFGERVQLLAGVCLLLLTTAVVPVLLAILPVGWGLWVWKKWRWARNIAIACGVGILFVIGQFVGIIALRGVTVERSHKARANCERLIPYLENYRKAHWRYPNTLTALDRFSPLPKEIDLGQCEYSGKNDRFSLVTDTFWTSYAYYDNETKEWVYVD